MKKCIILFVVSMTILSVSAQDLIITTNKDTIQCRITKIDSISVEYQIIKSGVREIITLPRKYIADFRVAENENNQHAESPANVMWPTPFQKRRTCQFIQFFPRSLF